MAKSKNGESITAKPKVIRHLFDKRYDTIGGQLTDAVVKSDALVEAIKVCNRRAPKKLSTNNPANFLKDFLRSPRRNELWPSDLKDAKITARQKYREKRVFAFAPYLPGQTEPFPDDFVLAADADEHVIESVSLASAARALGREDEAWLIQVCVHQRIVQTHFALHSRLSSKVVDLFHLQNSVKATPEIDAIFLLTLREENEIVKALVTLEAKRDEPILGDQIRAQVAYLANQCQLKKGLADVSLIVPVAAQSKLHKGGRVIALFEMASISVEKGAAAYSADEEHLLELEIGKPVAYRLRPDVTGI